MASPLPSNWAAFTDDYGRTYYHNRQTNQTSWTFPSGSAAPPQPSGYPGSGAGGLYPGAAPYSGPASGVGSNAAGHGAYGAGAGGGAAALAAGALKHVAHGHGHGGGHSGGRTQQKGLLGKLEKIANEKLAKHTGGQMGSSSHGHQGGHGGHHGEGGSSRPLHGHGHGGSVAAAHTFSRPMTFVLKEKVLSLSGDSFSVKDGSGKTHYKVEGKIVTLRDKKVLSDSHGHKLYRMKESLISLRSRQQILDAKTGRTVVTLRQKGFIPMLGTSTVLVWKGDSDSGEPWLSCKGNLLRKNFTIIDKRSGHEVCSVQRKGFNLKNILFEKDTYVAKVAAGVDSALMVFLVVAIDEVYRDDGDNHASNTLLPSSLAKLL